MADTHTHDPIDDFLSRNDAVLHEGRLGLLANMTSWSSTRGCYLWDALSRRGNLQRVFAPEHGLFAELQDQLPQDARVYRDLGIEAEVVSLYGDTEDSLTVTSAHLADLDALVVDLQDVGARYYTFATTLSYVFDRVAADGSKLDVWILDRPNPCGRYVEGIALAEEHESFVGRPGLPHRHGLTTAELASFYQEVTGADVTLHVLPCLHPFEWHDPVSPSPNMPTANTARVYAGGCLLEGTNLSEGRGTTRPFEIFGASWLSPLMREEPPREIGAVLRPLRFVPTFHKFGNELCHGWQIHLTDASDPSRYPSLRHMLKLLRWIKDRAPEFRWRTEKYEFRSDRPAIELLAADPRLLDYLEGRADAQSLHDALEEGEEAWLRTGAKYLRYEGALRRIPVGETST
ncbi:MAG: DUF1343 domain-containing protein [Planctomycetes bacterium]|nr:DUF1343 domain-containing protein [Planctomycetota bacterium]